MAVDGAHQPVRLVKIKQGAGVGFLGEAKVDAFRPVLDPLRQQKGQAVRVVDGQVAVGTPVIVGLH